MRWAVRLGAGLLVAVLGGCAVSTDGDARRVRPSAVPFELLDPEAPPLVPPSSGPTTQEVSLCFVRDGRLVVASLDLPPPVTLGSAVAALAAPPQALRPTVRTALTDPAIIRDVRVSGGIARVDLSASVSSLPADQQLLAVAQIVCTLTGRPGIGQVSFALEGAPLAVPNAEGSLVTTPVARDDYRALLS